MLIYLFQFVKHLELLQGTPFVDFGGPCGNKSASVSTVRTIKYNVKNKTISRKISSCFFLNWLTLMLTVTLPGKSWLYQCNQCKSLAWSPANI